MKQRQTRPYDGWLFVHPPSAIKIGSILRFEGSWAGTRIYDVVSILNNDFSRKGKKTATMSTDRLRLRPHNGAYPHPNLLDITVLGVCYASRWSLRLEDDDA